MKLSEIIKTFESRIPKAYQESWDHSGLNLGSPSQEIKKVLFSFDICKEVIDYAHKNKCQLIVSHHPFRMTSNVDINLDKYEGKLIAECIQKNISLYSSHTNHDVSQDSLNFHYLKKLKLKNIKPLSKLSLNLCKLIVFVPTTHTQKVLKALFAAGAGTIGNYDECSFRLPGTGTFRGNEFTNPAIGQKLIREEVQEERIETIVKEHDLTSVIACMKQAHPYEEVAYDIVPLNNKIDSLGLGAYGICEISISKNEMIKQLKSVFKCKNIRFVSSHKKQFKKIGICTGSGANFISKAIGLHLDLFITGDIKYHQAVEAKRNDLALADVGHYHSEKDAILHLKQIFSELFDSKLKYDIYTKLSDVFEFV